MGRLKDKVVIITGGASGIGEGTAKLFSAEGANVIIADLQDDRGEKLAHQFDDSMTYQHADVSNESDVKALVDLAMEKFGRLDCMFNNAGFVGVDGEIDQLEIGEQYASTVGGMFTGVVLGMKYAARVMKPQGNGSIINTASIAGVMGGFGPHVYSGLKAGVIGLTRSVALELAPFSIRVNAICPGGVATHIFKPLIAQMGAGANEDTPDFMRPLLAALHPVQRSGEPADIAEMALFLASDGSTFMTGQHLVVDGGVTSMRVQTDSIANAQQ